MLARTCQTEIHVLPLQYMRSKVKPTLDILHETLVGHFLYVSITAVCMRRLHTSLCEIFPATNLEHVRPFTHSGKSGFWCLLRERRCEDAVALHKRMAFTSKTFPSPGPPKTIMSPSVGGRARGFQGRIHSCTAKPSFEGFGRAVHWAVVCIHDSLVKRRDLIHCF